MEGHVSRDCSQEAKPKTCYKCGGEGHIVRRGVLPVREICADNEVSLVIALARTRLRVVLAATAAEASAEGGAVASATAAARRATWRVHALNLLPEATPATVAEAATATAAASRARSLGECDLHGVRDQHCH